VNSPVLPAAFLAQTLDVTRVWRQSTGCHVLGDVLISCQRSGEVSLLLLRCPAQCSFTKFWPSTCYPQALQIFTRRNLVSSLEVIPLLRTRCRGKYFETKKNITGDWGKWHEELYLYPLISWRIFGGWNEVVLDRGHMHLHGGNNKFTYCIEILIGKPEQKKLFWIYRRRYDNVLWALSQ